MVVTVERHPGVRNGSGAAEAHGRWMGVGRSTSVDAHAAGTEAATAIHGRDDAVLIVVFCSDGYDLPVLSEGIRSVSGETPLIGCSTAGEIATDGPSDSSVVVVAFGGPGFSAEVACSEGASQNLRRAGEEVAEAATHGEDKEHKVLLLLTDGLAGDQQEIVRGAYAVLGASVPLVGGCAGDDLKMSRTYQLFNDRVLGDSVVGAVLSSDAPLGIGVHHGWRKVGDPMIVTRSSENRVFALDDRPALDVYLERLSAPADARADPAAFTRFALTHPLGLERRSGEPQVRFIAEADFGDRSLGCIAEVPQGGVTWLMEGDDSSVLQATEAACRDALGGLDSAPLGMLAFDCIARRGVLGDEGIKTEIDALSRLSGGVPVAGFYTYGEIARVKGVSGFHNQTLVVLAVG